MSHKKFSLEGFDTHQLSINSNRIAQSIIAKKCKLFTSATKPARIRFHTIDKETTDSGEYDVMFKIGDDLRQD